MCVLLSFSLPNQGTTYARIHLSLSLSLCVCVCVRACVSVFRGVGSIPRYMFARVWPLSLYLTRDVPAC